MEVTPTEVSETKFTLEDVDLTDMDRCMWNNKKRLNDLRRLAHKVSRGSNAYIVRRGHRASCGRVYYLHAKKEDWTYQVSYKELMAFLEERGEVFPDHLGLPEETTVLSQTGQPRLDRSTGGKKRRLRSQGCS